MEKIYCPICRTQTNHEELFSKERSYNEEEDDCAYFYKDAVIQCKGCDGIQFRREYGDENMVDENSLTGISEFYTSSVYFPPYIENHTQVDKSYDIPDKIRTMYFETLGAIKNKYYILSGAGLRAIVDAICLDQKILSGNLQKKIKSLENKRLITKKEANRLNSIRFLGNDSIHEIEIPDTLKIRTALNIIEHLLINLYIIDKEANAVLDTVIINSYDDFSRIICARMKDDSEKTIKEIFGKKYRRIEEELIPNFTKDLIEQIKNGIISSIELGKIENKEQYFKRKLDNPPV